MSNDTRSGSNRQFWLLLLAAYGAILLPVLSVHYLPLLDYSSHLDRYYYLYAGQTIPNFNSYFKVNWQLQPNLGVDALAMTLAPWFGFDALENLLIAIIITTQFAGCIVLSRAIHKKLYYPVLICAVANYSYILSYGFVNFLLGLGLAFIGVAIWVKLSTHRPFLAMCISIPVGLMIFFAHGFAFIVYGFILASHEAEKIWYARLPTVTGFLKRHDWHQIALRSSLLLPQAIIAFGLLSLSPLMGVSKSARVAHYGNIWHHSNHDIFLRGIAEAEHRLFMLLRIVDTSYLWLNCIIMVVIYGASIYLLLTKQLSIPTGWRMPLITLGTLYLVMPPTFMGVGMIAERLPLCLALLFFSVTEYHPVKQKNIRLHLLAVPILFICILGPLTFRWRQSSNVYEDFLHRTRFIKPGDTVADILIRDEKPEFDAKWPRCAPMAHFLAWNKKAIVSTFSNSDQQPLIGTDLYMSLFKGVERQGVSNSVANPLRYYRKIINDYTDNGINYILVCHAIPLVVDVRPELQIRLETPLYTLYQNNNVR